MENTCEICQYAYKENCGAFVKLKICAEIYAARDEERLNFVRSGRIRAVHESYGFVRGEEITPSFCPVCGRDLRSDKTDQPPLIR